MDGDGKEVGDGKIIIKEEPSLEKVTPHISINTLKWFTSFHTLEMIGKVDKHPFFFFIMVNSWSTHNFIDSNIAIKL